LAIGRLVRHGGTVRVLLTTTRKENLMSENRSSGEGLFWSTSIAAGALALLHQLVQAQPAPTDVADQAATSQSSLMNWISPETLGLHKMQARRRIIRMTRGRSSINLMVWSRGQKEPLAILLSSSLQ
jgi:hypothetical protein